MTGSGANPPDTFRIDYIHTVDGRTKTLKFTRPEPAQDWLDGSDTNSAVEKILWADARLIYPRIPAKGEEDEVDGESPPDVVSPGAATNEESEA